MKKKINSKNSIPTYLNNQAREKKILNVICNTSILLMSIMTEAFSDIFTKLSKEMVNAINTGLSTPANNVKENHETIDKIQDEFPKQVRELLLRMKVDMTKQLKEKKEKIASVITDRKFNEGIAIVDRYNFNLPKLSCDLDEHSLFRYLILLKQDNEQFTKMFQELLEWMKDLPQS